MSGSVNAVRTIPPRRAADAVVCAVEDARAARERRHDHGERDDRPRRTQCRDGQTGRPSPSRERVPEPEPRDREPHQLAARHARAQRTDRERHEPVGVEEPDAEEEERDRERHGVEGVDGRPRDPGVGEVRRARGTPATRSDPRCRRASQKTRQRAERHGDDLDRDERQRRRRDAARAASSEREDRIDVASEPDHLLARRAVRHLERAAVGGAPDRLHHVSEVVAASRNFTIVVTHDEEQRQRPDAACAAHTTRGQACVAHEHGHRVDGFVLRRSSPPGRAIRSCT